MFGFEQEKQENQPVGIFGFDLEDRIAHDPTYPKKISKSIEARILKIKDLLRVGGKKSEFDQLAVILNGYISLQKVIRKIEAQIMIKNYNPRRR